MRAYQIILISLIPHLFTQESCSQDLNFQDTLELQHISKGLSQSSATKILEDTNGFLWIGTPNGLNKYNGTDFEVFEKSQDGKTGLTNGYVESIYEAEEGNLYIGTNKGLNYYDRALNIVRPFDFSPKANFLNTKYIGAICKTNEWLWLGTAGDGVFRYNLVTGMHEQLLFEQLYHDGPSNTFIVDIFELFGNHLLIVTQANVYVINKELQRLSELEPQNISTAIQIDEKHFFLGSHSGNLIKLTVEDDYSIETKTTPIVSGHSILSIADDSNGKVWIGSENAGLSIYDPKQGATLTINAKVDNPRSIQSNSIWSLHCAENGVMWLGGFKKGLSFYDPNFYKFKHYRTNPFKPNWLSNDIINCFQEDHLGNIWIGTDGGGLNYWDRQSNAFEHWSLDRGNLNSNVILTLLKDSRGKLWIGTWANGLAILDTKQGTYETWRSQDTFLGSDNVISIIEDHKGRIWIATLFGGIHIYNPDDRSFANLHIEDSQNATNVITPARLMEDSNHTIWVGSQTSGLFKIEEVEDLKITQYASFQDINKISNDFINAIIEDSDGSIWVGTQAGLNLYHEASDTFEVFTIDDGLIDDAIKGIIEDEMGWLWLSTSEGIVRFNPETKETISFDLYDGLQGNEFNASSSYKTQSGELLFGGNNGFNIFTVDQAEKRSDIPKIYFSSLKIFNESVSPNDQFNVLHKDISLTDSIRFTNNHSVINFEFYALTFRHPYRVSYAYFLEGFEKEWNYVGNESSATYTNLNPGNYTLRVRSTNSDGVWVENETSIHFTIPAPYWATWWFNGSLMALLLFGIYSIYLIRIRRIKKYQAKLENQIDERTLELQNKQIELTKTAKELSTRNEEIQRFAFAVSHDLKSPLSTIKGFTGIIRDEMPESKNAEIPKYFNFILSSCETMNDLISDITKIAKLGKVENQKQLLNANEIINTAKDLVTGRLQEKNAELRIQNSLPKIYGDKNRMIQVFENLIDNAIKYMGDQRKPLVEVKVSQNGRHNKFMVVDNGSGLSADAIDKLFSPFQRFHKSVEGTGLGLYMIQKIIESHEGHIYATSEGIGRGSSFVVSLPKAD